jgi:TRIAD3 protein (E3 ubiquitin-protein ligase RNF216)
LCREPAHIPLKCSEVEKEHETKGRLKVEEAISNAKIRTCAKPGCGKKFIKDSGCNKMTCACGTWTCYVCRALIPKQVSYKHFCQTRSCNHQSCRQCPLYSNDEEDDMRAMREAGLSAAEEVRGESLLSASDTQVGVAAALPSEVRVDVDSLLKEVPKVASCNY